MYYCISLPVLAVLICFQNYVLFYIQILPTCVDNRKLSLGIRLDLFWGICCLGDIPRWIQSNGDSIPFWSYLPQCNLTASPVPKRGPDWMLHLFIERIDYSFSLFLQVSEVPSLSAFKTVSGTANALTVGSARSPWWGKASWPRTRKSSAANVARAWRPTSSLGPSFPT